MKRFLAVSAIAVASCLGFNSTAHAQQATPPVTSTHSGTVNVTCAIGSTNGTLQPVANNINMVVGSTAGNFPKVLSSESGTGTPGSFVALCNTNTSDIAVAIGNVVVPTDQTGETVDYTLSAGSGAFFGAAFLTTHTGPSNFNDIPFNYADTPSTLTVSAKITAGDNKVLVGSSTQYSVPITATLTPQ
jgi:hypothetical protein